jgi:hypothetical protein
MPDYGYYYPGHAEERHGERVHFQRMAQDGAGVDRRSNRTPQDNTLRKVGVDPQAYLHHLNRHRRHDIHSGLMALLDIKPYIKQFDSREYARSGWVDEQGIELKKVEKYTPRALSDTHNHT